MNFNQFYKNANRRLVDAISGMWANDLESKKQLEILFEKEKLVSDPVFQSMFPWETSENTFENNGVLDPNFVNALDGIENEDYRFPKNRPPYKHQVASWKSLLNDHKSIVVTSGTGSGKTECFMLPVLNDISQIKQTDNSKAVRAIFLYPLNALIGSQKKRMHEWTSALENVKFAIYNGLTRENPIDKHHQERSNPEIISRKGIRENTPDIFFTNPTMLEYMLVRQKDTPILENSKGKLRWILLDEAHTLNGSTAAEIALLIRRVLDAFGVGINDVRFAATSATVGEGKDVELLNFMSELTGKNKEDIVIIKGKRVYPEIEKADRQISDLYQDLDSEHIEKFQEIHTIRNKSISTSVQSLEELTDFLNNESTKEERLEIIDEIASKNDSNQNPLLPLRSHFFVRGLSGIYTCTNVNCTEKHRQSSFLNRITTYESTICRCGSPMLEVVACSNCGEHLISGERIEGRDGLDTYGMIRQIEKKSDLFDINNEEQIEEDDENDNTIVNQNSSNFYLIRAEKQKETIINDSIDIEELGLNEDFTIDDNSSDYVEYSRTKGKDGNNVRVSCCPSCLEDIRNPRSLNVSNTFLNRLLAPTVLEEVPNHHSITSETTWNGKRFISFTDSRQGTAKLASQLNNDSERSWIRSFVYNSLAKKRKEISQNNCISNEEKVELEQLKSSFTSIPELVRPTILNRINELENKENQKVNPKDSRVSWKELLNILNGNNNSKLIYNKIKRNNEDLFDAFNKSLLLDQFSRRPKRANNLETMGLVRLVYPSLEIITASENIKSLGINNEEWQNFLKICIDYFIRENFHFSFDENVNQLLLRKYFKSNVYPSYTDVESVKKWPVFKENRRVQNRLVLILCAGLGYHSIDIIAKNEIDNINIILNEAWLVLKNNILTGNENQGYSLSFTEKVSFELIETNWICPITKGLLDCQFRGYSPRIKGRLEEDNINNYQLNLNKTINVPYFPYPYSLNEQGDYDDKITLNWIDSNLVNFKDSGFWTDLHERIFLDLPIYLAGEHSAQQSNNKLLALEKSFEDGKLNILSCSTTMEMGVDIGGISAVVMNNVPPKPANYLQRAGRAGRRKESKALALTFCSNNPIGNAVIQNPKWAMITEIASPKMNLSSNTIVQRHINAFFLGSFIRNNGGINIRETIEYFLKGNDERIALVDGFKTYLTDINVIEIQDGLNHLKKDTALENVDNITLKTNVFKSISEIQTHLNNLIKSYEDRFAELINQFRSEEAIAVKAVNFKLAQVKRKNTLTTLVELGFLPSAGIPTGIIDFDVTNIQDLRIQNNENETEDNPSFNIVRALKEYAPGASIIRNGWYYKSAGLQLSTQFSESSLFVIQGCRNCGYQHIIENTDISNLCPQCGQNEFGGVEMTNITAANNTFTKVIEPAGFAVDLYAKPERSAPITNVSYNIDALLLNMPLWSDEKDSFYETRENEEGAEILYVNKGTGDGFALCLQCGASKPENGIIQKDGTIQNPLESHDRLRGGRNENNEIDCIGGTIQRNLILGGRFLTDFCEIKLKDENRIVLKDKSLLRSLAIIFKTEFCKIIGIDENEIGFGFKDYRNYTTIFLYDTAKGGAGYSNQFTLYFPSIINNSLESLQNCDCKKSCTKCLVNRDSQWYINDLDRHIAIEWLCKASNYRILPASIQNYSSDAFPLIGSLSNEINRAISTGRVQEIHFYIDNLIEEWDPSYWNYRIFSENRHFDIKLIVREPIEFGEDQQLFDNRLRINSIETWAKVLIDNQNYNEVKPVCRIVFDNHSKLYFATDFDDSFNQNWSKNSEIFKVNQSIPFVLDDIQYPQINFENNQDGTGVYQFYLNNKLTSIKKVGEFLVDEIQSNVDIKTLIEGKKVNIDYSDRNLRSPLGCLMLIELIGELQKRFNLQVERIYIKILEFQNDRYFSKLRDNFNDNDQLNEFIDRILEEYLNLNENSELPEITLHTIEPFNKQNLRHSRHLEITTEDGVVVDIRPDGGVEYGFREISRNYDLNSHYNRLRDLSIETYIRSILYYVTIEK